MLVQSNERLVLVTLRSTRSPLPVPESAAVKSGFVTVDEEIYGP